MKKDFGKKLEKFASALEKIDVKKIFLEAVKETSDLALDLNKAQMTELSIDSEHKPLGVYKGGKRKGSPIIVRDTGDFQDAMFVEAKSIPIFIDSKDFKTPILENRWPNLLGLTKEFGEQYKERVNEVAQQKIKKAIEDKKKILQ